MLEPFTNIEIDLILEALFILQRDRYNMPNNFKDYQKKSLLISSLYQKISTIRPTTYEHA